MSKVLIAKGDKYPKYPKTKDLAGGGLTGVEESAESSPPFALRIKSIVNGIHSGILRAWQ
jgi:hypothetical protein